MVARKLIAWLLVLLTLSVNIESAASQRAAATDHLRVSGNDLTTVAWDLAPASLGGGSSQATDRLGPDPAGKGIDPGSTRVSAGLPISISNSGTRTSPSQGPRAGVAHHFFLLRSGALTSFSTALPPPLQR